MAGVHGDSGVGGGGAATNAGIDYQQRVAGLVLAACLSNVDLSLLFGFSGTMVPKLIRFESATPIDDLVFETSTGDTHYCQIKRTINLSEAEGSEFASVIDQFVREFASAPDRQCAYWLVVGNGASQRIRSVLRGLLDAIRLNPQAETQNPSSKEDIQILKILRAHFSRCFRGATGRDPRDKEFVAFAQKSHVVEIAIEHAQPHETVAMAYLQPISAISPELLWSVLVGEALTFSKERCSVTFDGLVAHNARFLADGKNAEAQEEATDEALRLETEQAGPIPTGKDVLLVQDWPIPGKIAMVELFRFDEACGKRQSYGRAGVRVESGQHVEVLYRSATQSGLIRFLEENLETFPKDLEFVLAPAQDIDVEGTSCARAHRDVLMRLLKDQRPYLHCLHCGRPIDEEWADSVELDDEETMPAVGLVHQECRRPVDRVLGRTQIPAFKDRDYLRGFDLEKWLSSITKGQKLFLQLSYSRGTNSGPLMVAWGGKAARRSRGRLCVGIELIDGTIRYITTRGRLDRYTEVEATKTAEMLNKQFKEAQARGNPIGYSSESWTFGQYEQVAPMMASDETFLECVATKVEPFTEHIARRYDPDGYYYAPLAILRNKDDDGILSVSGAVLAVTDPFSMGRFKDNWSRQFGDLGPVEIDILSTDDEFDELMSELEDEAMVMLVNPLFGAEDKLLSGMQIVPQSLLISGASMKSQ